MSALEQINFAEDTGMDIMGNAYEYLISQFQTESAKKRLGSSTRHKQSPA